MVWVTWSSTDWGRPSQGEWVNEWFVNSLAIGLRKVFRNVERDMKCAYTVLYFGASKGCAELGVIYYMCIDDNTLRHCCVASIFLYCIVLEDSGVSPRTRLPILHYAHTLTLLFTGIL